MTERLQLCADVFGNLEISSSASSLFSLNFRF